MNTKRFQRLVTSVDELTELIGVPSEIVLKAVIRSKLWDSREGDRETPLPCFAEMLIDQTKFEGETVESLKRQIEESYANKLY